MKKVILVFLAAIAFSCGDGRNRSSESGVEDRTEDNYPNDALEADTADTEMDTTSTPGMSRQDEVDTTASNP